MTRDHQRRLQTLLVHPDADRRAQGRALLASLPPDKRLLVVRWMLSPRRRMGRRLLGPAGTPLVELPGVDLRGADLSSTRATGADLRGADLRTARLSYAHMQHADLRGARLQGAEQHCLDLSGADLRGATGVDRERCWFDGGTRF